MGEVYEGGQEGRGLGKGVYACAAPHVALRESRDGECRYDAEVVAAAAESEVEIWVGGVIDVGDGAVGEDDLWGLGLVSYKDRGSRMGDSLTS